MNLIKTIQEFSTEEQCQEVLRAQREKEGIICKQCGSTHHYWLKSSKYWQCKDCRFRTSLKSGTYMENSKLPVRTWFLAMAFMTYSKKSISAHELQRQLGYKRYEPIWNMMHKIRQAMGNRDSLYKLEGSVEVDEGYIATETSAKQKDKLKRGRGSQKKQNVAVMAESIPLEDPETGKKSKSCRYFKMQVLQSHNAEEIDEVIQNNFDEKSIVFSDKSTSYVNISDFVEVHVSEISSKETTVELLPWVHIAISNVKRTLLGIYHKIKGRYLQLYLDEFCYKLNRRYFGDRIFERLLIALIKT
jgi:ribosomal protein L37AE/L43A